jgi:hypothetical protein
LLARLRHYEHQTCPPGDPGRSRQHLPVSRCGSIIDYTQEYPTLDYFRVIDDLRDLSARTVFDRLYLTKAEDWKYEREWRLLAFAGLQGHTPVPNVPPGLLSGGKGVHDFPTDLITRVIFGCGMPQADKDRVQEWIGSGKSKPRICEAREADGQFRLKIVEV